MMAAYTENIVQAEVTSDGGQTVVRFSATVPITSGQLLIRTGEREGEVTLTAIASEDYRQKAWTAFLDHLDRTPRDPAFMLDRPGNLPPVDRNLFPDD